MPKPRGLGRKYKPEGVACRTAINKLDLPLCNNPPSATIKKKYKGGRPPSKKKQRQEQRDKRRAAATTLSTTSSDDVTVVSPATSVPTSTATSTATAAAAAAAAAVATPTSGLVRIETRVSLPLLSSQAAKQLKESLQPSSTEFTTKRKNTHNNNDNIFTNASRTLPDCYDALKVTLASVLDVNEEDLVTKLTSLLHTLNETDIQLQSELQSNISSTTETTANTPTAATTPPPPPQTTPTQTPSIEEGPETVTTTRTTIPPSVDLTRKTRPSKLIPFDTNAFHINHSTGAERPISAAQKAESRAINYLVDTILDDNFSSKYSQQQIVLALHEASKHKKVSKLFKSAGLIDVEELDALRYNSNQIHRVLHMTNTAKKKK